MLLRGLPRSHTDNDTDYCALSVAYGCSIAAFQAKDRTVHAPANEVRSVVALASAVLKREP
jgi:hypothetical protein